TATGPGGRGAGSALQASTLAARSAHAPRFHGSSHASLGGAADHGAERPAIGFLRPRPTPKRGITLFTNQPTKKSDNRKPLTPFRFNAPECQRVEWACCANNRSALWSRQRSA